MNSIGAKTLERAWIKALRAIILSGDLIQEKDPFLEIQNFQIEYRNAFEVHSPCYTRVFGTEFLDRMHRIYSPGGDSATKRDYHKLIYGQKEVDQVVRVTEKLRANPLTRSATIILTTIEDERVPCVTEINFSIRNSLLRMTTVFKSSDVAKKFIPDMIELSHIHKNISYELGIARGRVTAQLLSAQVYESDRKIALNAIASAKPRNYFKTDFVIENWDKEAEEWDKNIRRPEHYVNIENGYARFLDFLNSKMPSLRHDTDLIALDSGCGTGVIAGILKNKGYRVFGTDISPQMLRFAHKDSPDMRYVLANSLDLPYNDAYFDVICSRGVLVSHVGEKYVDAFLDEHRRVLKRSGLFMFDFITHFSESEDEKRKRKAHMDFKHMLQRLGNHGFQVIARSGTDTNRVNAVMCKKIS